MITHTCKRNFSISFLITSHSPVWITNDSIHCSLPSNYQNLQKVGYDIVVFNGNVLGHAWHTWCKNGTNGKKMSCSLLICHMQIFKLIDFTTMGLWIWITFFFYALYTLYIVIHNIFKKYNQNLWEPLLSGPLDSCLLCPLLNPALSTSIRHFEQCNQ